MSDWRTVKVFCHSETEGAILVSFSPISPRRGEETWFPKSQITIMDSELVENPKFGEAPHIARYLGTRLTIDAPDWLARKLKEPEKP
jgi:hypothetical protein